MAGALALAGFGSPAVAADRVLASLPPPDVVMGGDVREYTIAPQDTLTISVFQVTDLNRDVEVDGAGQIRLPLIGTLSVAGKTARAVSDEIAGKLRDGYVLSPDVSVTVKGSPSQRVTVEGAVIEPGVYPIVGRLREVHRAAGLLESGLTEKELASAMKAPPWRVKKVVALARRADREALERAICRFADLEIELRGGGSLDEETAVTLALSQAA